MSALDRSVTGTLVALAPVLDRAAEQLPPVISASVNSAGIQIMPWLAGAPVTALLAWSEQMRDVVFSDTVVDHVVSAAGRSTPITQVSAVGLLDGALRVEAVVYTHRLIPAARGTASVTERDLRMAAAAETPLPVGPVTP